MSDEQLETYRRAVLGENYEEAPVPREKTFADHVADALDAAKAERRAAAPQSMADFAAAEREKLRPKLQRTAQILEHAAAYGYGSDQRRKY